MIYLRKFGFFVALTTSFAQFAFAALSAEQVIKRSHLAYYYQGKDGKAKVTMQLIDKRGRERTRVFTMLRKDEKEGGNQKYFVYFHKPNDVRRMALLIYKYPNKNDDRWLYVPSVNLVKQLAEKDSQSSFVGSDFTYEDVSGRDIQADTHSLKGEKKYKGKLCYLVQSVPRSKAEYARKLTWIDKKTYLPLKKEYYDQRGKLFKVYIADEIKKIQGLPTIVKQTMKNVKTGHKTVVTYNAVRYNIGLKNSAFSNRMLQNPNSRFLK